MLRFNLTPHKTCRTCESRLPVDAFHRHRGHGDGRTSLCVWCKKQRAAAHYKANRTNIRATNNARDKSNPEKKRARDSRYYHENRETVLLRFAEYRRNNKAKLAAADKAWYQANKRRHLDRSREYNKRNADQLRVWRQEYALAHRNERREYLRCWYQRNIERLRVARRMNQRARVARQKSAQVEEFTLEQLAQRMAVFGNRCAYCGGSFEHIDHVKPISRRGPHMLSNLRPACESCNLSKGGKNPFVWLRRMNKPSPLPLP